MNQSVITENSDTNTLVGYGALFGVIHIVTAPDHISTMITISVNSGFRAFFTGIKWGLGHSVGLFIIYGVLLNIDHDILNKAHVVEWIIGFVLLFLGFHGFYKAWKYHKNKIYHVQDESDKPIENEKGNYYIMIIAKNMKNSVLAITIGILHGLAGSGGILGVLPAIMIENNERSIAYLGMFCFTGIITMGIFSALWGEISSQITKKIGVIILSLSSLFSVVIGCLWISLLSTDKLDMVLGE